jgi:hypothetical protein
MSSAMCIVGEAMDAYRSFSQVLPRRMEGFPSQPDVDMWTAIADTDKFTLWAKDYVAAHPVAWWNVEEAKIVTLLNGLPLSRETKLEMVHMVRCLVMT